jgi:hypothetical protein
MTASSALCRKMRLHAMSHMDGETSVLEKRRFDTHLQKCEACRTLVGELSGMLEAVRAERFIPTPKGRDEMLADVLGRIEQASPNQAMRLEIPRQRRYRFRILAGVASIAAAAAVAVVFLVARPTTTMRREPAVSARGSADAPRPSPVERAAALDTRRLTRYLAVGLSPGARYHVERRGPRYHITVQSGRLWVSFQRSGDITGLEIAGNGVLARVTGTVLMVHAEPGKVMTVGVLSGEVLVEPERGEAVTLKSGEVRTADGRIVPMASPIKEQAADWLAALVAAPEARPADAAYPPEEERDTDRRGPREEPSESPADLYTLAEAQMAKGDYRAAARLLERLVRSAPASGRADTARLDLAALYTDHLGQEKRAAVHLRAYLRRHPRGPEAELVKQRLAGLGLKELP